MGHPSLNLIRRDASWMKNMVSRQNLLQMCVGNTNRHSFGRKKAVKLTLRVFICKDEIIHLSVLIGPSVGIWVGKLIARTSVPLACCKM